MGWFLVGSSLASKVFKSSEGGLVAPPVASKGLESNKQTAECMKALRCFL